MTNQDTQKWLMFENKSDLVEREYWELIGAGDSKENPEAIGFKGSGAKLALPALLRSGINIIITSEDALGPYILKYITKKTKIDIDRIYADYNNGESIIPTSLTTAGLQDWLKPIGDDGCKIFKSFKEFRNNAFDKDPNFKEIKVSKIIPPEAGITRVYLSWSDDFVKIYANLWRYFKFNVNTKPLIKIDGVSFFPRSDKEKTRIFIKGVLAYCQEGYSCFDYDIDDRNLLSDDKMITDPTEMLKKIFNAINKLEDHNLITLILISLLNHESVEKKAIRTKSSFILSRANIWRQAWDSVFRKKDILTFNTTYDKETILWKYNIIKCDDNRVKNFLLSKNIPNSKNIYNDLSQKEIIDLSYLNKSEKSNLALTLMVIKSEYPDFKELEFIFFTQKIFTIRGEAKNDKIWLNKKTLSEANVDNSVEKIDAFLNNVKNSFYYPDKEELLEILEANAKLIGTIIHEYQHITSGHHDLSREFRKIADEYMSKFIIKLFLRNFEL